MRLYEHLHLSIRKSGLKKYKNQGIYDNSDASSWSLLRNGLWISSVCGKNTNVTMENIPGYVRSEYSCHVLISPARGSAFLSWISAIPQTITQNWFLLNSSTRLRVMYSMPWMKLPTISIQRAVASMEGGLVKSREW